MNKYYVRIIGDVYAMDFWANSQEEVEEKLIDEEWVESLDECEIWQ